MQTITCPRCASTTIKKNGHIHTGKQNYRCHTCGRQFGLNPTQQRISESERDLIKRLLLERISLLGICRVMHVSLTWLLDFLPGLFAELPDDLNISTEAADGVIEL